MIRPYLTHIIKYHKSQGEWKVHSGNAVTDCKTLTMHTKSNNTEIMKGNETNEIIEELFESLLQKYQERLEEKVRGSEFVFDNVDLLHYNLHKVSLNRSGSYIDSPECLKSKEATINLKNNDDKCFQYATVVALNQEKIKKEPQRTSKIQHFINNNN